MKRLLLAALVAAACMLPAQAQAQPTTSVRDWALGWEHSMEVAWGPYSTAHVCLASESEIILSPGMWFERTDGSDAEWLKHGRVMRGWTRYFRARFTVLWHRMTHPRVVSVASWRPLAEWVCYYGDDKADFAADARKLLRCLEAQYGPRPHLSRPHSTLQRLYREYFTTHKHAPAKWVTVTVEVGR